MVSNNILTTIRIACIIDRHHYSSRIYVLHVRHIIMDISVHFPHSTSTRPNRSLTQFNPCLIRNLAARSTHRDLNQTTWGIYGIVRTCSLHSGYCIGSVASHLSSIALIAREWLKYHTFWLQIILGTLQWLANTLFMHDIA